MKNFPIQKKTVCTLMYLFAYKNIQGKIKRQDVGTEMYMQESKHYYT